MHTVRAQAPLVPFLIKILTFNPRVPSLSQTRKLINGKKKNKTLDKNMKDSEKDLIHP